jgi:tetratricopeptide (TPR) repeat protein
MAFLWHPLGRSRWLRRRGRTEEAIAFINATLEAVPGLGHWRRRAALLNERALSEVQVGKLEAAHRTLLAAVGVIESKGRTSSQSYAGTADNLGYVAREAGDLATAAVWHDEAIAVYEQIGGRADLSRSLVNAAIVSKDLGLLARARAQLERAMAVVPAGRMRLRGHIYATGALLSQITQEFDRARGQHLQALLAYRRASDRENEALELHNLAIVERLRDRPAVAARLLRKSMALNQRLGFAPGTARDLQYLGLFTFDAGKRQEGLAKLRQAWHALAEVNDVEGMLWCELDLVRIGMVTGAHEKARGLLDDALVRAEDVGDPRLEYNLLVARGAVHEQLQNLASAMDDYERAITKAESLRAEIRDEEDVLNFFRFGQWAAFDAAVELAVRRGDAGAAWRACQNARSRELQRLLRFDAGIAPKGIANAVIDRERSLLGSHRHAMVEWRNGHRAEVLPRLEAIERELAAVWDEMRQADPEYVALRRGDVIAHAELRELLTAER